MELKCINCEAYPSDYSLCAYWEYTHQCPKEKQPLNIIEQVKEATK